MYVSPRLATERHRVTKHVGEGEQTANVAGVARSRRLPNAWRCVGTDINETAIEYLQANAERNGVADRMTGICGDVREVAGEYEDWADRVVMNLPHSADEFLETAVRLAADECVVHYYDIQHEDDLFGPGEKRSARLRSQPTT